MFRVVLKGHYQRLRRQYLYFVLATQVLLYWRRKNFVLVKQTGVFGVVLEGD